MLQLISFYYAITDNSAIIINTGTSLMITSIRIYTRFTCLTHVSISRIHIDNIILDDTIFQYAILH